MCSDLTRGVIYNERTVGTPNCLDKFFHFFRFGDRRMSLSAEYEHRSNTHIFYWNTDDRMLS